MKRSFFTAGLVALILLACPVGLAQASPAAPFDFSLSQPDGTTFLARSWGDEWQNGVETLEGYTILQTAEGWWVYTELTEEGALTPALRDGEMLVVGQDSPDGLQVHQRPLKVQEAFFSEEGALQAPKSSNIGTQPILVLLVEFSDRAGTYPAADFSTSMFGASSSVKDYYADASYNQLTLSAAAESHGTANDGVVGWLNLGYAHPNPGTAINNINAQISRDALQAADGSVNFAPFDTNSNGYISSNELHIVIIVAGFERSYSVSTPSVWGHRGWLNPVGTLTLDGKIIGDFQHGGGYAQFGEIHEDHQATIGIMVHELGHDLTWPDLYDLDGSSSGVGLWSVMSSGNWNGTPNGGESPAFPDAYLKYYQGWITPTAVNGTLVGAAIQQSETNAKAFLLRPNPNGVDWNFDIASGTGEFFLVENRQKTGYDAFLPGCGLLIWHIDESVTFTNNANANETHPLVKLLQADGLTNLEEKENYGDGGDPYPGTGSNYTFNHTSVPNSRLYNGTNSLVTVSNISTSCSASMSATLSYLPNLSYKVYLPLVAKPASLRNGNFEAGADGSWVEYSAKGYDLILLAGNDPPPHGGAWHVWLGGDNSETARLTQSGISLSGLRYLHFWYWMYSTDTCGKDYTRVKVNGTTIKTYDMCAANNTPGWVKQVLDLNSYANTTITLQFEAVTNASNYSSFYLDDVSVSASSTVAGEDSASLPDCQFVPR